MTLNRDLGSPLHHQIYMILREAILSGRYPPASMLPSEEALSSMFAVSRITIRRSLENLERAELIERQRGRGTFVRADHLPPRLRMPMAGIFKGMEAFEKNTTAKVLEFGYEAASPHIREMLGVKEVEVQRAVRIRFRNRQPIAHLTTWVPGDIGRTFSEAEMGTTPLFRLMQRAGIVYVRGEQTVSATLADTLVAARLKTKVGAPLLELHRQVFDKHDRIVEYIELVASPDFFRLRMSLDAPALTIGDTEPPRT